MSDEIGRVWDRVADGCAVVEVRECKSGGQRGAVGR